MSNRVDRVRVLQVIKQDIFNGNHKVNYRLNLFESDFAILQCIFDIVIKSILHNQFQDFLEGQSNGHNLILAILIDFMFLNHKSPILVVESTKEYLMSNRVNRVKVLQVIKQDIFNGNHEVNYLLNLFESDFEVYI